MTYKKYYAILTDIIKKEDIVNRKVFSIILTVAFTILAFSAASFAADQKTPAPVVTKTATARPMPPKANFGMIAGTITSIDNTDPANVKLQVKNDADGSTHTVSVTPWTNITKVTDISELKTGEPIRMMTRKVDDKDVAMGIMFGKMKAMPQPAPKAPMAPPAMATNAKK